MNRKWEKAHSPKKNLARKGSETKVIKERDRETQGV